jgi:hypothetical protein
LFIGQRKKKGDSLGRSNSDRCVSGSDKPPSTDFESSTL